MRTFLALSMLLALCNLPAAAQEHPKGELFGGYQFIHIQPDNNASGWNAAITGNLGSWLGVTADFSGAYKNGGTFHTIMAGPVFSVRKSEKVTPFVHALVGVGIGSRGGTDTAFATALGGGIDVRVSQLVAVRLVQADWLILRPGGETGRNNARVSAGSGSRQSARRARFVLTSGAGKQGL
jgi:opacity protein-like surface antigen